MADYHIERVLSVKVPELKDPVVLHNLKEVNGEVFVLLAKSDRAVCRLLLGKTQSNERALAKTSILETLIACRNQATMSAVLPAAAEDLGLDDPRPLPKKKKIDKSSFPPVVEVIGPTVAHIEGIRIKVLPETAVQSPLWVHLTPTVAEYLAKVSRHQVETSERATRPRHGNAEGVVGVSFDNRRDAFRARRGDGSQKYFSGKSHVDPAAAAAEWVAGNSQEDPAATASQEAHVSPHGA